MDGLLIRSPFNEEILSGIKTWEIRGSNTRKRGIIALIRAGSGLIVGTCELVDVQGPLTLAEMRRNTARHRIPAAYLRDSLPYVRTFAWVLRDAKPLKKSVPYEHPSGAVIWVKLPEFRVAAAR